MSNSENERFWWGFSLEEVSRKFECDLEKGLSSEAAKQHLDRYGRNVLPEPKPFSLFKLFLSQFSSFIIWLLIVAAILAGALGEWINTIAILLIVVLNAVLGFVQEVKAERSLAALKRMLVPTCKVIRDGILQTIPAKELVLGDLVMLEAGDFVPADGRVVYSARLSADEASLTGESVPVNKISTELPREEMSIGDRTNMAFMGTTILSGKGHLIVTETGVDSELGKIAELLTAKERKKTPLQIRLAELGRSLTFLCIGLVFIVFLLGLYRGISPVDMLLTAMSLAVAAVPEGLPAIVTIGLALGVREMARRHAIVRRLPSIETLGSATVICTDKTGTLTRNEMSIKKIWVDEKVVEVSGMGYAPEGDFKPADVTDLHFLLKIGVLCNNAELRQVEGEWKIVGDPTEGSLLVAAVKAGLEKGDLEKKNPLLEEAPFDSERKRMSILRQTEQGSVLFVKGAPDIILALSTQILMDGKEAALTDAHKNEIEQTIHRFAKEALRVLALAYRKTDKNEERDLVFVGLVGMIDLPREEVSQAIATCKQAGILPVMITGDYKDTAVAIGKEIHLLNEESEAISGMEIDKMNDEALKQSLSKIRVFARVSPSHKERVVRLLRSLKQVVAVTGDGVNDAPALKEADIGVAMGIKGTDVAKETADMVITDDNFASIVNAAEEGRRVYDNIIKFVNYLLSCNIAELLIIFLAMAVDFRDVNGSAFVPLTAVQLLFLNLVTDGLPATALALDPIDPHAMERPPRKSDEPILTKQLMQQIFLTSLLIAGGALVACLVGMQKSAMLAQTMTFTTLVVLELVRIQMVRSRYNLGLFSNRWVIYALASSLILQITIIYVPSLQKLFGMTPLGGFEWAVIAGVTVVAWALGLLLNRLWLPIAPRNSR